MNGTAAVLPGDLGEWSMLGDTGAHALGAVLGVAVAVGNGRVGLVAHAAAVVAAAVCGDRVTAAARAVCGDGVTGVTRAVCGGNGVAVSGRGVGSGGFHSCE
jgi:hypothetical protein